MWNIGEDECQPLEWTEILEVATISLWLTKFGDNSFHYRQKNEIESMCNIIVMFRCRKFQLNIYLLRFFIIRYFFVRLKNLMSFYIIDYAYLCFFPIIYKM